VDGADLDLAFLKKNPVCRGDVYLYDIFDRQHFFKEYFDFIILYDVIEHIQNVKPFLEASLFHLKPGGFVFLNVPALKALHSYYDNVVGHWRRYDQKMLAQEMEQVDLEVIHINYWGFSFLPLLLLRKIFIAKDSKKNTAVQRGFDFNNPFLNSVFKAMIWGEVAVIPNPILGTSVMAIARRKL
jgi:SAM-dependent methyltransferase